jgi:hypothetical protein
MNVRRKRPLIAHRTAHQCASLHRDFASLRLAVIVLDAVFQNSITQTFPAGDARLAFDLAENEPGRTIKVQLDFTG